MEHTVTKKAKNFNCNNFVIYHPFTWRGGDIEFAMHPNPGIEVDGKFYKWRSYNKFETEPLSLPKNAKKKRITKDEIKKYCGVEKIANKVDKPKGSRLYFTAFAGKYDVPYIVYIGKDNIAYIYKIAKENVDTYHLEDTQGLGLDDDWKKWRKTIIGRYTELVGKYKFVNKFITDDAILLQLNKNKYLLIWENIVEFEIEDTIKEFFAPIPGSYATPYAFGNHFVYFMIEYPIFKIPIKHFAKLKTKKDKEEAFQTYLGMDLSMFEQHDLKIKEKIINKRK